MKSYDFFVSYSAHSNYRDGGKESTAKDRWPELVATELQRHIQEINSGSSIAYYVSSEAVPGENWSNQVAAVAKSKTLIPIISESYFSSRYCFYEWLAFVTGNVDLGKLPDSDPTPPDTIFPICRFEEIQEGIGDLLVDDISKRCHETLYESIREAEHDLTPKHEALIALWTKSICGLQHTFLSDYAVATRKESFRTPGPRRNILELAKTLSTRLKSVSASPLLSTETNKLQTISLLGLGMDRFASGGWGFSMGPEFERDDDGHLLEHGRYELNLLVLRALREYLPTEELEHEIENAMLWALGAEQAPRFAKSPVRDRKRRAAALSALLNALDSSAYSSAGPSLAARLGKHDEEFRQEICHSPINERWVVEETSASERFDDIIFFDLSARAKKFLNHPIGKMILEDVDHALVNENYQHAVLALKKWLSENPILKQIDDKLFAKLDPSGKVAQLYPQFAETDASEIDALLLNLRLICSIQWSASAIARTEFISEKLADVTKRIENIVMHVKTKKGRSLLPVFAKTFPTYCLALQDLAFHFKGFSPINDHSESCIRLWNNLLQDIGGIELGAFMNASSWAASLMLAERSGMVDAKVKDSAFGLWKASRSFRDQRRNVVLDAVRKSPSEARALFDEFVSDAIQEMINEREVKLLEGYNDPHKFRHIFAFGHILERVIPGKRTPIAFGDAVGLLLVDANTDRVITATAGFNAIYIEPFSVRIGLGLKTLERLIYELGETDTEFIEALSNSVVVSCWSLDRKTGAPDRVDFAEHSNDVNDTIGSQQISSKDDPGISLKDLLCLRTNCEGTYRYVLRTCSAVTADDIVGISNIEIENSNKLVMWTFVDVSEWKKNGMFGEPSLFVEVG